MFLLIVNLLWAEYFSFGFSTPYNQAIYTHEVNLFHSFEDAMKANPENVIALKANASSKNILEIKNFQNLRFLVLDEGFTANSFYLNDRSLNSFFEICNQLPHLEYLAINDAKLIPYIKEPEKLKGLKISKFDRNSFETMIPKFKSLEILIIDDQRITVLSPFVGGITSLRQIELYTESVPVLPELNSLPELLVVRINTGKIKNLPKTFAELKSVRYFNLTGLVDFKAFPSEIFGMESLEELRIELRNADKISDEISKLTHLKSLHLIDCNKLKKIPQSMESLSKFENLSISGSYYRIDATPLLKLKNDFSITLIRCNNYAHFAEQLQNAQNLKEFIVPANILPAHLKKIEQFIPQNKIKKINL